MTSLRFLLALALLPALGACDSAGPDPDPGTDPGSVTAAITISLDGITAVRDCDAGDNPGDFHFRVAVVDGRNQAVGRVVEIPNGAYGTNGASDNTVQLDDGSTLPVRETITFSLPEETGSAFTLAFSMTEWDTTTSRDPDADDVTQNRTYDFRDGRFQNIAGAQSITAFGTDSSTCRTSLAYTITVE